ncbi:uncharacterized protein LOC144559543 [Carex rostrata]
MSCKSKPKGAVLVAGTARGGKLSTGYARPIDSASTPDSKLKSTPDQKSTSGQNCQTPVKVPNYLRASTGSCHDFCKYGGRRALEEEERKGGSHSSKKKSGLSKGPKWKDIVSYDATPRTAKPQVVPLDSKKVVVPTNPKSERSTGLARQNLQRRASLEISCSGTKPVVLTPVKNSSAPAKKVGRPGIFRKERAAISNKPKIQDRSEQKVNRVPTDIVRNCSEVDLRPTHTTGGNGGEGGLEKTLYVVEPELEVELVKVDFDSYKEKTIEEPDVKETTEIDFGIEEAKGVKTNEVSKCEDNVIGNAPVECLLSEIDKSIRENSTPMSPDKETVVESDLELDGKSKNSQPDKETVVESDPELDDKSKNSQPDKETVVESDPELGDKSKNSQPDKGTVVESECGENTNSEAIDETVCKSESISSESGEKFEPEFESSAEEEESMEFESESESGSVSLSRSASSGSVESASKNEKLKVERSNNRRSGSNQLEEKKPYKLKFKPARVIELKPESDSGPRRLKFRKPRVAGENPKFSGGGRKVSYKKRSGSDLPGSNSGTHKSAGVVLRHQDGMERNEGQNSLFNNVIEETASKLVESRKSKVKALVGAFETVISLQDGKPTSTA